MGSSEMITSVTLSQQVFEALKGSILRGELAPGERLVISAVAARVSVSSTPVRDALTMLVNAGFAVRDETGIYVIELSREDVEELYDLREVLEGLAVRATTRIIPKDELDRMQESFRLELQSLANGRELTPTPDLDFHDEILRVCPNRRLRSQIETIMNQTYRIRIVQHSSRLAAFKAGDCTRLQREITEHIEISTAMQKRDEYEAEQAMRAHIANAKADVLQHIIG